MQDPWVGSDLTMNYNCRESEWSPGKESRLLQLDETVPQSATVLFALDLLSDGVSLVQFTPSSTISPQVESCSLG